MSLAWMTIEAGDWRPWGRHTHSALGMMAPARFALGYRQAHRAAARAGDELRSPSGLAARRRGGSSTLQTNTIHQLSQQVDR